MKIIDSKWVFKLMRDNNGNVYRFKARLCARGFMQQQGVDFTETFVPVRYDSLRMLLAVIAAKDLELTQFDVQTAFLHGELKEEICMAVPEGLKVEKPSDRIVYRLRKALYGFEQVPRYWNKKFCVFLKEFNFKEIEANKCIFIENVEGFVVYLALFVDDGLIAAKSRVILETVIEYLNGAFKITLSDTSMFVDMQIERDREKKSVFVQQSAYAKRVIDKFRMSGANPVSILPDSHTVLHPITKNEVESEIVLYRETVGSLMFLAIVSRPDIAYSVNLVSKYLNNHNDSHWRTVKRIFAYLTGTSEYGIEFRGGENALKLVGYSDADYANDTETRKSTTDYFFELKYGPITWCSKKRSFVTMSTMESEYVAASAATREAVWLRRFMRNIHV